MQTIRLWTPGVFSTAMGAGLDLAYGEAMKGLGFTDFTGTGGFYCWMKLPGGLTAAEFNRRLFRQKAAILPGELCDMHRRGEQSPLRHFLRLSFGPRTVEDFDGDMAVMKAALKG